MADVLGVAAAGPKVGNAALLWTTAVCTLLGYFAVMVSILTRPSQP